MTQTRMLFDTSTSYGRLNIEQHDDGETLTIEVASRGREKVDINKKDLIEVLESLSE